MKVFNIVKNITIVLAIIILIGSVVVGYISKDTPTPIFNYYFFTIGSGSMENTLKVGDTIIVKKANKYKVGDIVTHKKENRYITHRIQKINGNKITTKGDANFKEDTPFDQKDIVGKVVFKNAILSFIIKHKLIISIIITIICIIDIIKSLYMKR